MQGDRGWQSRQQRRRNLPVMMTPRPGLKPGQAKPKPRHWLGLAYFRAKATAFRPSQSQNITSFEMYDFHGTGSGSRARGRTGGTGVRSACTLTATKWCGYAASIGLVDWPRHSCAIPPLATVARCGTHLANAASFTISSLKFELRVAACREGGNSSFSRHTKKLSRLPISEALKSDEFKHLLLALVQNMNNEGETKSTPRNAPTRLPALETAGTLDIYHPSQPNGVPILVFQAYPTRPDSHEFGVPLGVILDACFVIAKNKEGFELRLAARKRRLPFSWSAPEKGIPPVSSGFCLSDIIKAHGSTITSRSFAAWVPPPNIPSRWKGPEATPALPPPSGASATSNISTAVRTEDKMCVVTGAATALQASHLVPKSAEAWQSPLVEGIWGGESSFDLHSPRNELSLRSDLNSQGLDQGLFLFAPYADRIVAVFVRHAGGDLAYKYHLQEVNMPPRIVRGYLFIRFAWNVFQILGPWVDEQQAERSRRRIGAAAAPANRREVGPGGGGSGGTSNPGDVGGSRGGGGWDQEDLGGAEDGDGEDSLPTEDEESGPGTDDEAQLAVYESQDAALQACASLTVDDVQAGRYPGFSKFKRLAREYRLAHPEVSAVRSARVWEGDEDNP
ncbi:hypothetical protein B0H14DRAFT_2571769 [Mycena olivaceomarginata]|nr:hypothetical protein B0H14DRAFT_2571769 [Mycena olivaceomarginata]